MTTQIENASYFMQRFDEAALVFPLLAKGCQITFGDGATIETAAALNSAGVPVFNIPPGFDVPANDAAHHVCKHEAGHAYARMLEAANRMPFLGYLSLFRDRFGYDASVTEESWAEVFCNACEGAVVTSKIYHDETVDPLQARAWFLSLAPAPAPMPPPPDPVKEAIVPDYAPATWLPSPNFWEGRPGPIRYIVLHTTQGTDSRGWLTNPNSQVSAHYLIQRSAVYQLVREQDCAWHAGIIVGTPTTPLYDGSNPNLESIGIEMEGFAADLLDPQTITAAVLLIEDIRTRHGALPLVSHSELSPGNRTDPGIQNREAIEFALGEEDDMFSDADRALLQRAKDLLEAEEPKVWLARLQRGLDVETGQPFDASKPPLDPRIKA